MSGRRPPPRTVPTLEARGRAIRTVDVRVILAVAILADRPEPVHTIGHALQRAAAENA